MTGGFNGLSHPVPTLGMNQQGMSQGYSGPRQQGNYMQTPPNVSMGYRQQQPNRGGPGGDGAGGSGNANQPSQAALQNPQLMAQLQRGQQHYQQNRF